MTSKKEVFKNFRLYAVTDVKVADDAILQKVDEAYHGGADIVQLRSKHLTDKELISVGKSIRQIADKYEKLFFVNDRVDIAIITKADGVHLGQDDLSVREARQLIKVSGLEMWVGKSTHSMDQALQAVTEEPDYIGVGPVYSTPTKPDYKPAGLEFVRDASEQINIPFVCIGGIDLTNMHDVLQAGGARVAVVRAIFQAENSYDETRKLRECIEHYYEPIS